MSNGRVRFLPRIREELRKVQGGCCAICGVERSADGSDLCIDHCHDSADARGLLCRACNIGLGSFRDQPHALRAAIAYLENPPGRAIWQVPGNAGGFEDGIPRSRQMLRAAVAANEASDPARVLDALVGMDALLGSLEVLLADDDDLIELDESAA